MKFTVNWLKNYVDFDLPNAELVERLTMLGLEVDAVENLAAGLEKIMVAKVVETSKHPNADRLTLCDVLVGDEPKRIVCGAPNVRPGLLTPIALPGTNMPGGFKIKKSKIRGEVSEGMMCSESELGIGEGGSGIMELPDSCHCGQTLVAALGLDDTMIEVDLTPNRPDCTSVIGVAREVAGFTGNTLKLENDDNLPELTGDVPFSVEVKDPVACPRYAARLLKNVTIEPSPWWLQRTLLAVGLRPINNIVDITNFVMLEHGQPLHAFDFNKLVAGKVVVRMPVTGEKITTLDGIERDLEQDMLLICDAEKPIAVAGVMGGANSEVDDKTCDVLLESAYFEPVSVRRTSRRLKLSTDASYRFERGVDSFGTIRALERAACLIVELAGAELVENGVDQCAELTTTAPISLRASKTCNLLGIELSIDEIAAFLNGIEIKTEQTDSDTLLVTPPSFRIDLEREIDLVEEIARLKGYNEIPTTLPVVPMTFSDQDESRALRQKVSSIMVSQGLSEVVNYSFTDKRHCDMLGLVTEDTLRNSVEILNPLTEEQGVMRTMLLPGLLGNVRHNLNRQNNDLGLFEIGKVFWPRPGEEQPLEGNRLGAVFCGRRQPGSSVLHFGEDTVDLLDVRGAVEVIFAELRLPSIDFTHNEMVAVYAGNDQFISLSCDGKLLGSLGIVKPSVLKQFSIKNADVYFLDLDLDAICALQPMPRKFAALSKYPAVKWDLAVVVSDSVGAGEIVKTILTSGLPLVAYSEIFDIYRGKPIQDGCKSVALSITYHSEAGTLDDDKVGKVHKKVIDLVLNKFGGQLREV